MPWDLTLPPRHSTALADPVIMTAQGAAEAAGYVQPPTADGAGANPLIRAATPAEREEAAWAAGYGVGALTERRKLEAAGAVKSSDEPSTKASAFSWDEIAAETNAQAGVSTRSES